MSAQWPSITPITREAELDRRLAAEVYVEALQELPARRVSIPAIVTSGVVCWLPLAGFLAVCVWVL